MVVDVNGVEEVVDEVSDFGGFEGLSVEVAEVSSFLLLLSSLVLSSSLDLVTSFGLSVSFGLALSSDLSSFLGLESDLVSLGFLSFVSAPNDR